MRFWIIEDCRDDYPVRVLCDALGVSPSGYYAWRTRPESLRKAANRPLLDDIRRLHADHHERYRAPRIHAALRAQGRTVSRGRVESLMHRHGLHAQHPRVFRVCTTDSSHALPIAPNLLDRNFAPAAPNQVWLTDIPYVPTDEGWLYVAVVLDLFSRKAIGWGCTTTCAPNYHWRRLPCHGGRHPHRGADCPRAGVQIRRSPAALPPSSDPRAPGCRSRPFHVGRLGRAAWYLRPLHERLLADLKASGKLFADETTAPVLDPGRGNTKTGQLWAYARDDRPWNGPEPPAVAYVYAPDRKAERPVAHLWGFAGVLQVDGYAGYRKLAEGEAVRLDFGA